MAAVWLPDSQASHCGACKREFSLVLRRHHCRVCGKIFCDDCSNRRLPIPHGAIVRKPGEAINMLQAMASPTKLVRVCLDCWAVHKNGFTGEVPPLVPPGVPQGFMGSPGAQPMRQAQVVSPQGNTPLAQGAVATRSDPPGEYFEGPPVPANPGDLPPFPVDKDPTKTGNLFGMTKMAFGMLAATKAHRDDPHLSREDNVIAQANAIKKAGGIGTYQEQLVEVLQILQQHHMPEGLAGFVITEAPKSGTLGFAHGLRPYDLMYGYESTLITADFQASQFSNDMKTAFASKGTFLLLIYSFQTKRYRRVLIVGPPGKPNAVLGAVSSQLPVRTDAPSGVAEASMDMFVKAWKRSGGMYISSGHNAVPLYAQLTSENQDLYVKVARNRSGMWISTGEYHPLYNYTRLTEPLYVEVWRQRNGMLVRMNNEYGALPMERMSAAPSAQPSFAAPPAYAAPYAAAPADYTQPQSQPMQNPYNAAAPQNFSQPATGAYPMSTAGAPYLNQAYNSGLQQQQIATAQGQGYDLSAQTALMAQYSGTGVAGMPSLNTANGVPPELMSNPDMINQLIAASRAAAAEAAAGNIPPPDASMPVTEPSPSSSAQGDAQTTDSAQGDAPNAD